MRTIGDRIRDLFKTVAWLAATLTFTAVSLGFIIGFAWLFQLAFPSLPDITVVFALLLGFALYLLVIAWVGWKLLKRHIWVE